MRKPNLEKWSHRAMPAYMACITTGGILFFTPDNWWGRLLSTVQVIVTMSFVGLGQMHNVKAFCEYCANKTPADTAGAVQKKHRSLRFYHRVVSLAGLAYLFAMVLIPSLLPRPWPAFMAWAALLPGFLWMIWSWRVHDLLKPWCPWCRHRGWNDELVEPSPDPHGKKIPVS